MGDGSGARGRVDVGLLKLSLTEPDAGRHGDYFEWYDRDHAYSANLAGPGVFSGRLWHASDACEAMRYTATDTAMAHMTAGRFLSTFFVLAGDEAAWAAWSTPRFAELGAAGRSFSARTTVLAQLFAPSWVVARDEPGVPLHCALDHPFAGVAIVVLESAHPGRPPALEAVRSSRSADLRGGPVALAAGFAARAIDGWPSPASLPSPERHTVELWFFDTAPSAAWAATRLRTDEALARSSLGRIVCFAPFEPTVPGGDPRTLDQG